MTSDNYDDLLELWLSRTPIDLVFDTDGSSKSAIGKQVAQKARIDVGIGWLRHGGFSLDVGFNSVLSGPRFGTRSRFNSETGTDGIVFVDGSVVYDPDTTSPVPDLLKASLAGERSPSFIVRSQQMARHLYNIQTAVNTPGLLTVVEGGLAALVGPS